MPKNKKDNLESDTGYDTDSDSGSDSDSDSDSDSVSETIYNKKKIALGVGVGVALLVDGEQFIEHYEHDENPEKPGGPNKHDLKVDKHDDVFKGEPVGFQGETIPADDWEQYRRDIFLNDEYDLLLILDLSGTNAACGVHTQQMVNLLNNGGAEKIQAVAPQLHILPISAPHIPGFVPSPHGGLAGEGYMDWLLYDESPEAKELNSGGSVPWTSGWIGDKLVALEELMWTSGTVLQDGSTTSSGDPLILKKINGEWAAWEPSTPPDIDQLVDWVSPSG